MDIAPPESCYYPRMSSDYIMARRETLQAMGLILYVARYPLPGAAMSPFSADPTDAGGPLPAAPVGAAVPEPGAPPAIEIPEAERPASPGPAFSRPEASIAAAEAGSAALAPFTLAAVALGGCLWLEELPDGVLGRDQVQLIRAICRALGWPVEPVSINQFAWPMHRNPQFDQGADAAFAALSAFVHRQLDTSQCERLIVLGQPAREKLRELPCGITALHTQSTRDMLRDPLLKRDTWHDLRSR